MSRVHEAMKRAAAEAGRVADALVVRPEPAEAPFMSPWEFGEAGDDRAETARRIAAAAAKPAVGPDVSPRATPLEVPPPAPVAAAPRPERVPPAGTAAAAVRLESLLAMKWPQPFAPDVAGKLVASAGVDPHAVEQYRRLAAQVTALQQERGTKVLFVTSARPGEGKTLTVTNLALCLAEQGRRVLLVDANAPRPGIHKVFQVSAGRGVSAGLAGAIELTGGLALVPGGRGAADPSQVPEPAALGALLEAARASYDWILVESPAAAQAQGVRALAELADATLVVASPAAGPAADVEQAIGLIGRDRVAGLVVNRVGRA